MNDELIEAADAAVEKYRAAWRQELAARRAIEAEPNSPPHNHWEPEFKARQRLRAAKLMRQAVREVAR